MLDADLARLERERLVVLYLDDLDGLLCEPAAEMFVLRSGPDRGGIDELAAHVERSRAPARQPDRASPAPAWDLAPGPDGVGAGRAAPTGGRLGLGVVARRHGRAQHGAPPVLTRHDHRRGQRRVAYGAGYLASTVDNVAAKSLLVVTAGIALMVAWVVSWMVIESTTLDWRQSARQAFAYDLIARATLEVVTIEQRTDEPGVDRHSGAPVTDAPSTSG